MSTDRTLLQENLEKMSLALLRKDYTRASLSELDAAPDPITQFSKWFEEARQAQLPEPNAMSVATASANGRPSSRIILLKEFDQRGFTWYTNYASRKGQQLHDNPHAALLFYWSELERQVAIEGRIERVSAAESDSYFQCRPVKSRLGAIASEQSQPIANRQLLDAKFAETEQKFGDHPPRPEHWGGYRLVPERIEFWQGRSSRLHDRILYRLGADGVWQRERLQP